MLKMERCFSCAEYGNCTELYVRKPPDYYGPYFPTFERYNPPSSSNMITPDGTVKVCELCKIYLKSQWQNYELFKKPESQRIYFTKRHDGIPFSGNDPYPSSHSESSINNISNKSSSFPWGKSETQKSNNMNPESSVNLSNKTSLLVGNNKNSLLDLQNEKLGDMSEESSSLDINYPGSNNNNSSNNKQLTEHYISCFVCGLPCLKWHAKTAYSSQMLENKEFFPFFEKLDPPQSSIGLTNGATKICIQCEADLSKQWDHYEKLGTDQMSRIYHITNDHSTSFSITNPGRFITNSVSNSQIFSLLKLKNPLKCALCLNKIIDSYKVSWNPRATCLYIPNLKNFQFQGEGIMVDKQNEETVICDVCHYFLSCQNQSFSMTPNHLREYKLPKIGPLTSCLSSNETKLTVNSNRKPSLGSSLSAFLPADSYQQQNSQCKRSKTPNLKVRSKTPVQINEHSRCNSISKSAIINQEQTITGPIIANCHICLQELRDPNSLKTLRSVANEDYPDQPFFPFLKSLRTNSMKNYEFPVCPHCYYNMCGQWRMSQKASIPIYERKYNHNEFMCTQCQRLFAQKTDTLILRDRLVCIGCSENRNSDAAKSGFSITNQDIDASAHGLVAVKTKTTVTVTPISNELSIPSLASFNYAETMKQYSKPSISTASTPSVMNNSLGQFVDSFSRNSSISSDIYYNSKNMFAKSVKRPVVAAVAPNQRQNTPLLQQDSNTSQTDFSHLKMSDMTNFPGNYFSHSSAFNPFSNNLNTSSSNNSFAIPMFSSNSPFGIPSHSPMSRKHPSTNSDREFLLKHNTASFSSPYIDQKNRLNPLQNSTNPFINWQQPQPPLPTEANPLTFPFQSMIPGMDTYNSPSGLNKDAEAAMKLWLMSQNQLQQANSDPNTKFSNSWLNNSQLFEEMASNYCQMMLSSSMGISRDDLMTGNSIGSNNTGNSSNSNSNNNNLQSWMAANTAMASYHYYQVMQMLASSYQSSMVGPHGLNKPPAISSWLNQLNFNDPFAKLYRQDASGILDPLLQSKLASNSNGFNNLMKNSDFMKNSFGLDYEKAFKSSIPFNQTSLSGYSHPDLRSPYQKPSMPFNNTDRMKLAKSQRDEPPRNLDYKTPTSSPKPTCKVSSNIESKLKKTNKASYQSDVLDLSQTKSSRKSAYAIESLTEQVKKSEKTIKYISATSVAPPCSSSSVKTNSDHRYSSQSDYESPINMSNSWSNNKSMEIDSDHFNQSFDHTDSCDHNHSLNHPSDHTRMVNLLKKLNANSLVELLTASPKDIPQSPSHLSSSPSLTKPEKYPTIWQFHKFFKILNTLMSDLKSNYSLNTRSKSLFMKELGLEDSFSNKRTTRRTNGMKLNLINHINSSSKSKKTKHEIFWIKWILRNLRRRLSLKNKPHLLRSLMRPVLSGDTEVRFCAAKNKHELENLRSIIKILIKYT